MSDELLNPVKYFCRDVEFLPNSFLLLFLDFLQIKHLFVWLTYFFVLINSCFHSNRRVCCSKKPRFYFQHNSKKFNNNNTAVSALTQSKQLFSESQKRDWQMNWQIEFNIILVLVLFFFKRGGGRLYIQQLFPAYLFLF